MHDRWKSTTTNSNYTFTQGTPDTTITIAAGTIAQIVETLNVAGGVYTLSWTGTATARIAINGGTTSGAYAASPITTSSATAGQTITVEFSTGTLGKVQFEPGTIATPYERQIYSDQLAQCQRYCYVSYSGTIYTPHAYGYAVTATSARIGIQPAVTMRVAPSLTYSGNIGVANGSDSTVAVSALTIQDSGINMMTLQATTASSFFTIGQGARVLNVTDGSGKLILSAEL
jgi:hypothetical protein